MSNQRVIREGFDPRKVGSVEETLPSSTPEWAHDGKRIVPQRTAVPFTTTTQSLANAGTGRKSDPFDLAPRIELKRRRTQARWAKATKNSILS
jgi:hypothetical protein